MDTVAIASVATSGVVGVSGFFVGFFAPPWTQRRIETVEAARGDPRRCAELRRLEERRTCVCRLHAARVGWPGPEAKALGPEGLEMCRETVEFAAEARDLLVALYP